MTKKFEGHVNHTEDSIKRLFKTTRNIYDAKRRALRMLVGAMLVIVGLVTNIPLALQGILIMIGCWILVSRDFPAQMAAEDALQARKKKGQELPKMRTIFFDTKVRLEGEGKMDFKYERLERLTEDESYFYLFLARDSVIMLDKETLQPDKLDEFKEYLSSKTKLEWMKIKPWYHMSIFEILRMLTGKHN